MSATKRVAVLIVEDEGIVALDLQQALEALGYDAFAIAASADEAIESASKRCPDIALMDIRIKGARDGIETARILRERFGVAIIYLTAHADDATISRAKETAPVGYLLKPVNVTELRSAIEVGMYRHRLEQIAAAREQWLSTALESVDDAVITVDLAGMITSINPAAEALLNVVPGTAIGHPLKEMLANPSIQADLALDAALEKTLEEGVSSEVEAGMVDPQGRALVVRNTVARIAAGARTVGAIMILRDVTKQRLAQQQVELNDRLASLGTMAAGVAHEINNPLTVVLANAEFTDSLFQRLESQATDPRLLDELREARALQQETKEAGERIRRIVLDLKTFARPAEIAPEGAEVMQAVHWAVRATSTAFREPVKLDPGLKSLARVAVEELRLGQVLVNLLLNAAQAITMQNEHPSVVVRGHMEGDNVVLEVEDTGTGMTSDVKKHIFEPFFTTKSPTVGTGLGLAICQGILQSAGGSITIDSELGKGTTVRISIPKSRESRKVSSAPPPSPKVQPDAFIKGRILVVDDQEMVLKIMRRILRDHEVTAILSAEEAITQIENGAHFDLIFSDLIMPTMTGIAFYEWALSQHPDLIKRIVFMSGGTMAQQVQDFLRRIPNLCIEKPFNIGTLLKTVQDLLRAAAKG